MNTLELIKYLTDLGTQSKYKLGLGLELAKFVQKTGVMRLADACIKYPFIPDALFNLNTFYETMTKSRTGLYKEANAILTQYSIRGILDLIHESVCYPKSTVLHEEMIPPEILYAMGLNGWVGELMGMALPFITSKKQEDYIDIAENNQIAPDTCSLPKGTIGMALAGHIPSPKVILATNMPCDGGLTSYTVIQEKLKVPAFRLDVPYNFKTTRARKYFVDELKRMIAFLEENTCGKMDWDKLKEICEIRNKTVEAEMDIWEMIRIKPAPMAGEVITVGHLFFLSFISGRKYGLEYFEKIRELCQKNMDNGQSAIPNEKFRALLWNPMMASFPDLMSWSEENFGVSILMDMMSFNRHPYVDTSSIDSMLYDLGTIIMEGPMVRHTRGPSENFFNDMFHVVDYLNLDMIWMAEHVGCKNTKALNGMFREKCRQKGIPVLFINYDLTDTRIVSNEQIKKQITDYMETVMKTNSATS